MAREREKIMTYKFNLSSSLSDCANFDIEQSNFIRKALEHDETDIMDLKPSDHEKFKIAWTDSDSDDVIYVDDVDEANARFANCFEIELETAFKNEASKLIEELNENAMDDTDWNVQHANTWLEVMARGEENGISYNEAGVRVIRLSKNCFVWRSESDNADGEWTISDVDEILEAYADMKMQEPDTTEEIE
jgi:hypothetical protein